MIDTSKIIPNQKKAVFFAKKQLPELVTDAVNLEGINITLPEVQTLLEGVTIGGHKLSDIVITTNQAKAWQFLFDSVLNNKFCLTKEYICNLHNIAAFEESLTWGAFRDGGVKISGTKYMPPKHNELEESWFFLINQAKKIDNIYKQAVFVFLQMARNKFFYDVNKRMGRFVMNGILLQKGYSIINIPVSKKIEFNTLMIDFYESNNTEKMTKFMISCLPDDIIELMN